MKKKKEIPKPLKIINKVKNIFFGVLVCVMGLIIVMTIVVKLTGNAPNLFGYSVFRVSSESMKPTLEYGDVILVGPCDPMTLSEGDVITFHGTYLDQEGKLITHRVVKTPYYENNQGYVVTRGDANAYSDNPVKSGDVVGKMMFKLDILRAFYNFFITPWGLITLIALLILAYFNEIVFFVMSLRGVAFDKGGDEISVDELIDKYSHENEPAPPEEKSDEESDSDDTDGYIF